MNLFVVAGASFPSADMIVTQTDIDTVLNFQPHYQMFIQSGQYSSFESSSFKPLRLHDEIVMMMLLFCFFVLHLDEYVIRD